MNEHLFLSLTLDRVLASPNDAAETCNACFQYAVNSQRPSAMKAIQMIVKKLTSIRLQQDDISADPELEAYRCLFKVIEAGIEGELESAETIKKCLSAFNALADSDNDLVAG